MNRLGDLELRRLPAFNQVEHQRGRADFHGGCPFAHVRVSQDEVETAKPARVGMRLVTRVDQWAAIHGVDADHHTKKICVLRNLIDAWLTRCALCFDAQLARTCENLALYWNC